MNHVTISGNVTRDPEIFAPENSEYSCIKFGLANNDERKKDSFGNWTSVPSFFDVEYWTTKPQEWLCKIHKGDSVFAECRLKQQSWEKEGQKHSKVVLVVTNFPYAFPKQKREEPAQSESDIPF